MKKFTFEFNGRTKGALGVNHYCNQSVLAETLRDAELKLYDTHEHIHGFYSVKEESVSTEMQS